MSLRSTNGQSVLALIAKHPRLFSTDSIFWSHVSDGWVGIVDKLLADIDKLLSDDEAAQIEIKQIKEKFGMLRFYSLYPDDGDTEDEDEAREPTRADVIRATILILVRAAEAESKVTCETCGQAGVLRETKWRSVKCDKHAASAEPEPKST